ncbi:hypothetical protein [Paraconexibacter algicola]|uniref:Uncharacterized protein n=1 Tax=Paraconexibacter algicola TaxID=2133960 RepID=A0A2T4UED9_9ACTN|nr:hypothetical protein [Paraconexibacter algicola]PTL56115.1 hypothetical protein C7Y72_14065 [Paraconexibacter algicola]
MSLIRTVTAPARLALHVGHNVLRHALELAEVAAQRARPDQDRDAAVHVTPIRPQADRPTADRPAPAPTAAPTATPVAGPSGVAPSGTTTAPADTEQPEFQPPHVDDEREVVHSSADAGAEDEVGATLRVDEPWPGYTAMTVPDIADRLVLADTATLAAVQLYEQTHRARKGVLVAVDEQLERAAN